MEVLYQPETLFTRQTGGGMLPQGSMHHQSMYFSPREVYSYYPCDSPSRTPTPEQRSPKPYSRPSSTHSKTLQSVLMGEVPAAYSHLTSSTSTHLPPFQRPSSVESTPDCVQTEPMDLSCKRSPNPYTCDHSDRRSPPVKCYQQQQQQQQQQDGQFSLLRNLLSVGKTSLPTDHNECSSPPAQFSWVRQAVTGSTRVTLAKKNMLPVSARVSHWLVKVVHFAKSIPEFINLSHNDKVTLILNSWSRLLLLCMAESNFQFAVTPLQAQDSAVRTDSPAADEPTMKSVEGVQTFIRKCQHMDVETKEYAFLKMLVLFNAGYIGLDRPEIIDRLNLSVQQLLQQHVVDTRPDDVMHYSRLLLCLPALYGIDNRMIENLFCRHINKNTDMEVLLKEMLQNM